MSLYIQEDYGNNRGIATRSKSLKEFVARYLSYYDEGMEFRVYKSQAAWRDGFDYVSYYNEGGKLKKSNEQPIADLNRFFAGGLL